MQSKGIFIALALIIMSLGAIGAAFATGMNFSNVGALSSSEAQIPQVNVDHIGFLSTSDGSGVDRIALSFDRDLTAGSTIWITIYGKVYGYEVLADPLPKDEETIIQLQTILKVEDIWSENNDENNQSGNGNYTYISGNNTVNSYSYGYQSGGIQSGDIVVTVAER